MQVLQMDEASAQLQLDLRHAVQEALATRRPLLHRLNTGPSWLLQIPRPESAVRRGARFYYNILIDPDFATSTSLAITGDIPLVGCVAELEELARELEILASCLRLGHARRSNAAVEQDYGKLETLLDAVFITRCQHDVHGLLAIHPDVPILALQPLHKQVTELAHFRTVTDVPIFGLHGDRDWRSTSIPPLPDWMGIGMLPPSKDGTDRDDTLVIAFNNGHQDHASKPATTCRTKIRAERHAAIQPDETEEYGEAIVLATHAPEASAIRPIVFADPPLRCLAHIHRPRPKHDGLAPCCKAERLADLDLDTLRYLKAEYWIHAAGGLELVQPEVDDGFWAWLLQFKQNVLRGHEDSNEAQKPRRSLDGKHEQTPAVRSGVAFVELQAGESRVLH